MERPGAWISGVFGGTSGPKVFLSYRRKDPVPNAQVKWIGEMCEKAGFGSVFVDRKDGAIPPGAPFRKNILREVAQSDVIFVLIGEEWGTLMKERKDNPENFVQIEIGLGLELEKQVIPILLGGEMPKEEDLPVRLKELLGCQAKSFDPDALDELLPGFLDGLVGDGS